MAVKITKIGEYTNQIEDLKCEFCDMPIPKGKDFYSVVFPIQYKPAKHYLSCEDCLNDKILEN